MSIFGALESLRQRPIGDLAPARAAREGFRSRVPIARENALFDEAMGEAREDGLAGEDIYCCPRNPLFLRKKAGATERLLLRRSVAEKLARANARAGAAG